MLLQKIFPIHCVCSPEQDILCHMGQNPLKLTDTLPSSAHDVMKTQWMGEFYKTNLSFVKTALDFISSISRLQGPHTHLFPTVCKTNSTISTILYFSLTSDK